MNPKAFITLEYDKIRAMCASFAASDLGKAEAEALTPVSDLEAARTLLKQTWEADAIYRRTGRTPVESFPDIRNTLRRAPAAYSLSMSDLLGIARCLTVSRRVREALSEGDPESELMRLSNALSSHRTIEDEIARCILSEEEMSDNASPALSRIRRQMRITNERVRDKLNSIVKSTTYQKYLQEPIITMRNGRYAIPVKAEHRAQIGGLVHDQSSSGQTLFIEPTAVVERGNEYKRLLAEEKQEIERILAELSAECWRLARLRLSIAAGVNHTLGIKADGSGAACGKLKEDKCNVFLWKDLVAVAAGTDHSAVRLTIEELERSCDHAGWVDVCKFPEEQGAEG